MASNSSKKVLVPIANGSEEMEAVITIDILRRAGADVTVASVEETLQVEASRKVVLVADVLITECSDNIYDMIVLPGGMPGAERLRDNAVLKHLLLRHAQQGRSYAAICAAPVVALQSWGLLKGKHATAHPAFASQLEDTSEADLRVVRDDLVTTSRGPGTTMEFALDLVSTLYGSEKASEVADPMVMLKGDGSDTMRLVHTSVSESSFMFSDQAPPKVLVPVANGTEEMEAVVIIDVLRRAGAQVTVASVEESRKIVASRRVQILADVSISEVAGNQFDLIVLPGGMPGAQVLADSQALDSIIRAQCSGGRLLAAICAAPTVVLERKGLLQGKKATAHPGFSGQLDDQAAAAARVVSDGLVVTSRGPGTAMEFALYLVERLYGKEKFSAVAQPMVVLPALWSTL